MLLSGEQEPARIPGLPDKFFLHLFCSSMHHYENSAVTALGCELFRGGLQYVAGLDNNMISPTLNDRFPGPELRPGMFSTS